MCTVDKRQVGAAVAFPTGEIFLIRAYIYLMCYWALSQSLIVAVMSKVTIVVLIAAVGLVNAVNGLQLRPLHTEL